MKDALAGGYENTLAEALHIFKCYKDTDVQNFLNHKAIDFECRGWATTYLLLNKKAFDNGIIDVEGYFSLTHKALTFDKTVSKSTRNKLAGSKNAETQSFVLIGQLGKYMEKKADGTVIASALTAQQLLDDAFAIIEASSERITCRNILIECKPIKKVKDIYLQYGFHDLQFDGEQHSLYHKLDCELTFPKFPE